MTVSLACIDPSIDILRYNSTGTSQENYSHSDVFYLSYQLARIGGCWDCRFNVNRRQNEIGSLVKGDIIEVQYLGTTIWYGWVDDFETQPNDLEIRCIGAVKALQSIYPNNRRYGSEADSAEVAAENEYNDISTASGIIESLYDGYLGSSSITKVGINTSSDTVKLLELTGNESMFDIYAALALNAGNWAVGIDETLDIYFNDPSNATHFTTRNFRTCVATTYQITDMSKEDSAAWSDTTTKLVIVGAEGFKEAFLATELGYSPIRIAGVNLVNERTITLPWMKNTIAKSYSTRFAGSFTTHATDAALGDFSGAALLSADACAYADEFFYSQNKEMYSLECEKINTLVKPWNEKVRLFDRDNKNQGVFLIDMIEYDTRDADLTIRNMRVTKE